MREGQFFEKRTGNFTQRSKIYIDMSKYLQQWLIIFLLALIPGISFGARDPVQTEFYKANNPDFQYVGRVDFSNPLQPRFWMPGVYIRARFTGTRCRIFLNDEQLYGNHNYIEIIIDDQPPFRIRTIRSPDTIDISSRLQPGTHTLVICKDSESGIGYLAFLGMECDQLLPPPALPQRKMEFVGNSITCGYGNDKTIPCGHGVWYDQENAYESYAPVTARALHAQWYISAVSGIGLIHSCCGMNIIMPPVYDKVDMRGDSIQWDFSRYQPDVLTICLGQNDGIQDSTAFCSAYVKFIGQIRTHDPETKIICLSSPMANAALTRVLQKYITSIVTHLHDQGDQQVYRFFFSRQFNHGCAGHPDIEEDRQIAGELTAYVRQVTGW
jgi:hypothetical protein